MKRIIAAFAIAGMVCGSAAWADKPVQYPGWTDIVTGAPLADCGDFWILVDFRGEVKYERHYFNNDGSINRIFWPVWWHDSIYYNSNDPSYWVAGTAEHQQQWLYFKDGVPVAYSPNGPMIHVNIPGYGPVALVTGTWEFDLTLGRVTFMSNPHNWVLETGEFDAFCAALRP